MDEGTYFTGEQDLHNMRMKGPRIINKRAYETSRNII